MFSCMKEMGYIGPNELKVLEKSLKKGHAQEIRRNEIQRNELNIAYERIQKRFERMYEDKIDGKITAEFYERKFKEYSLEKEQILNDLKS